MSTPETIPDDTQTAEHHQSSSEHGVEEIAREGVEDPSCDGEGDEVVDRRPEEVLVDRA